MTARGDYGADWPYVTSTIGWVAPCVNHKRRMVADVLVPGVDGASVQVRLCRECQDGLLKQLRKSIPRRAE